jgi:hypothetical protein
MARLYDAAHPMSTLLVRSTHVDVMAGLTHEWRVTDFELA